MNQNQKRKKSDQLSQRDLRDIWKKRAFLKNCIRNFFNERNYLEVDTPIAVLCPGTEANLDYFKTKWIDFKGESHPLWLRSSPELHMKQVLSHGMERIFQMAPSFRNHGELSEWHQPEFLMLEWYKTNVKFDAFIDETLGLLRFTHEQFVSQYLNETISFKFPEKFEKWTLKEVFQEFVGLELIDLDPDLSAKARERGVVSVGKLDDFETAFFKILIEKIEPKLEKLPGLVLYDYPASQAALAIVEGGVAKRFEVYINGIELCNGFKELLDHHENKIRIQEANILREQKGKEKVLEDLAFLESLKMPIPTTCGNALGLERWLALLQGAGSLDAVIPFRGQFPFNNERFPGSVCSSTISEPIASDFSTQTI